MTTGIYGIFENDECLYVGQSTDVKVRWYFHRNHLAAGTHHTKEFQDYYTAHSPVLEFRILVECPGPELHLMEKLWFDELNPRFWGRLPNISWRWTEMGEETLERVRKLRFEKKLVRLQKLVDTYETEAKRLYVEEKLPLTEVGIRLGLSYSDARNIVARAGVKLRTKRQSVGIERNRDRSMDEVKAEIIELRAKDLAWHEIAELWDCGTTSVRGLAIDFGLLVPKPEIPIASLSEEELKSRILELENQQLSIDAIAKELGIGRTTLWRRLYKLFPERYESTRKKLGIQ